MKWILSNPAKVCAPFLNNMLMNSDISTCPSQNIYSQLTVKYPYDNEFIPKSVLQSMS